MHVATRSIVAPHEILRRPIVVRLRGLLRNQANALRGSRALL